MPPEAQGDAPPPGGRGPRSWLVVVALVVVLVGLVVAGVTLADGDDGGETADDDTPSTTAGPSTTTSSTTTTTTAPPWQEVASDDGAFSVSLPEGWESITVTGDMTGRGWEMFPNDAVHAGLADQVLSILVTPQTRFVALDGDAPAVVEQTDILLVESGPSAVGQQAAYEAAKQYTDGTVVQEGTVQTVGGEANWFEYVPANVSGGIVARNYVLVRNGTAWLLTFWSADMEAQGALADQLVGSFAPA